MFSSQTGNISSLTSPHPKKKTHKKTQQNFKEKNSQQHQSGFNLEKKNKKKWTHAETNTWSKCERSLLFEQWPDKIAPKLSAQDEFPEEPRGGVSSM